MRQLTKLAMLAVAIGCTGLAGAAEYHEAPAMAELVKGGKLPPVAERLPSAPEVVQVASVGRYGGSLRSAIRGDGDHNAILRLVGNQGLTRWDPAYTKAVPALAASWTVNANATEYTFKLRPGAKWSDGVPFTADDITFVVNDLFTDKAFFESPPSQYVVGGKPMRAEKIDDATVKLIFAAPYLRLPDVLATPLGQHPTLYAKHYCSQFMPKYNPDLPKLLAAAKQPDWPTLFRQKCGDIEIPARWGNPEKPVMDPWVLQTPYGGSATQVLLRRNPYFWQVDQAGNQLPYIDSLTLKVISDVQAILLAEIGGQVDLQVRQTNTINNKPVLAQHAKEAGYVLQELTPTDSSAMGLWFNQSAKNPKTHDWLRNRDFRQALSLAMDRDEINEIVFLGQGKPWQIGPLPTDKFYNERLGTQYIKHDPAAANAILDRIGLAKKDSNGMRLTPAGDKLFISIDAMVVDTAAIDTAELLKKQWAAVGIELGINTMERSLYYEKAQNADYDIGTYAVPGGMNPTLDPRALIATHTLDSRQSIPWVRWYATGGKQGEEPSEGMKERMKLWDAWTQASDPAEAEKLVRRIMDLAADGFEVMGTVQAVTTFGSHSVKLMNVPEKIPFGWDYPTPAPALLQQFYFTN